MRINEINTADWHRADVKAALEKKGMTLTSLALARGLRPGTLSNVFRVNYPKAQRIIAEAIGVPPETIWPSRY
ncbi:helix-turn-helix domain-containing protein [Vibrio metschnikovii]|nr:helix-turn-helix domain-containing protein [Vibrio metschnikovii]